jgi:hypothetical protein
MSKRQDRVDKRVCDHVRAKYKQITVQPRKGLFNQMCFDNAVQYYHDAENKIEIFEVITIKNGDPILHYINYDVEKGVYLETTLGYKCVQFDYYLIREVHKDEFNIIQLVFSNNLGVWTQEFTTWIDRTIFRIKRAV